MYTVLYVDDEETLPKAGKLFLEGDGRFSIGTVRDMRKDRGHHPGP
jgi:hypothetical protein